MELKEVFEPVLKFIKSLQKKEKAEPTSKQAAKDRLKLVLMQDRASVSPDFFEMMKKELIDVIKKYIEIDEESLEVQLTRGVEAGLEGPALYANIPIKNVKSVAPKAEEDDDEDELEYEEDEVKMSSPAMSEEEADKVAEEILSHLEGTVTVPEGEENINEEENNKNEEKTEKEEKENKEETIEKGVEEKQKKKIHISTNTSPAKKTTAKKKTTKTPTKKENT